MDDIQRYSYGLKFEAVYLREKGKAFETLFQRIMAHAFPGDFEQVRPYGAKGDLKCDGFRVSDGTVFQSYGPDVMTDVKVIAKVHEDFAGAVEHWDSKMRRWEFVHNDARGLSATVVQVLEDLRKAYPNIEIEECAYAKLRDVTMALKIHQLEDLFGAVPSRQTMEKLDFAALRPVVVQIERREVPHNPPLNAPSARKLEKNDLSKDAVSLLATGRQREKLVQDLFDAWPDPDFGEQIAQGFRERYQALRDEGFSPNGIFGRLQEFAGGMDGTPAHQGAVLAVLSYFFERCDIYEDASEDEFA